MVNKNRHEGKVKEIQQVFTGSSTYKQWDSFHPPDGRFEMDQDSWDD